MFFLLVKFHENAKSQDFRTWWTLDGWCNHSWWVHKPAYDSWGLTLCVYIILYNHIFKYIIYIYVYSYVENVLLLPNGLRELFSLASPPLFVPRYEGNLVCLPANPAYFIDRINNGNYRWAYPGAAARQRRWRAFGCRCPCKEVLNNSEHGNEDIIGIKVNILWDRYSENPNDSLWVPMDLWLHSGLSLLWKNLSTFRVRIKKPCEVSRIGEEFLESSHNGRPMGFQQTCGENGGFNGKTIGKP